MNSLLGVLFLLLVLGFGFFLHLNSEQEDAKSKMITAESVLGQAKSTLAEKQLYHQTLKRHYDTQRQIYDSNQALTEMRSVMTELQKAIESQKRAYQSIVETRRNSAKGKEIEQVALADGRVLKKAKILNFDDMNLTVSTTEGVLRIRAQELPSHLRDYFRLDLIEPDLNPLTNSLSNSTVTNNEFEYTVPTFSGAAYENVLTYAEKNKELNASISLVMSQIHQLENAKNGPLVGFDANIRSGSAAHKYRVKARNEKIDRAIAVLNAKRNSLENQRKELQQSRLSSR